MKLTYNFLKCHLISIKKTIKTLKKKLYAIKKLTKITRSE